jgi:hypothetical protein
MAKDRIRVSVNPAELQAVQKRIEKLLEGSRREMPALVKRLARGAANSAAKLTIPNQGKNTPVGGSKNPVRHPKDWDKFRPLVTTSEAKLGHGNFYVVKGVKKGTGKRAKKRKRRFNATNGQFKVMRGSQNELVIYTTKKVSQKDKRFTRVKKLIKMWNKRKRIWSYVPTLSTGKYDRTAAIGKIPHYFTAKQGWLWASRRISKGFRKLNPGATKQGYMTDRLKQLDSPSLTLHNTSNYAHRKGGRSVPHRALVLALRGFNKQLKNQAAARIARAAKKRG